MQRWSQLLVNVTRIPRWHFFKFVKAHVDASCGSTSLALFEPDNSLDAKGLSIGDAAIELKPDETLRYF